MRMPSFYDTATPPMEGYEQVAVRVLLNPSKAVWLDYLAGGTEATDAERQLQALNAEILTLSGASDDERSAATARLAEIDQAIATRRQQLGRALSALYGTTDPDLLDFRSPEAALATVEHDDLPDEVIYWLLRLPNEIVGRRRAMIEKNLPASFETTQDS